MNRRSFLSSLFTTVATVCTLAYATPRLVVTEPKKMHVAKIIHFDKKGNIVSESTICGYKHGKCHCNVTAHYL